MQVYIHRAISYLGVKYDPKTEITEQDNTKHFSFHILIKQRSKEGKKGAALKRTAVK